MKIKMRKENKIRKKCKFDFVYNVNLIDNYRIDGKRMHS